jgi:hypothetical protein
MIRVNENYILSEEILVVGFVILPIIIFMQYPLADLLRIFLIRETLRDWFWLLRVHQILYEPIKSFWQPLLWIF